MSGAITAGTLATIAGVGAAGSIGGALIGANASGNAASTQANAADQAAQLQYKASQDALDFQKQEYNQNQQNLAPWLQSGTGALNNLDYLLGINPQTSAQFQGTPASPSPFGGTTSTPAGPGTTAGNAFQTLQQHNGAMPAQQAYGLPGGPTSTLAPGRITATLPTSGAVPGGAGGNMVASNPVSGTFGTGPSNGAVGPTSPHIGASGATGANLTGSSPAGGFGSLLQPYGQTFSAPTDITEQNDPGYQARLKLGTDAIQRSAAANGGVLTGGTLQALDQFGQDYGSNEYQNVYNRALNNFDTNYNVYNQNQANQFNRLAAIAGVGQTAAGQLATSGQAASNNVTSNLLNTSQSMGNAYQNAAAANASGIVGSANAYAGALNSGTSNLSNLLLLSQLYGGGGSGGSGGLDDPLLGGMMGYGY